MGLSFVRELRGLAENGRPCFCPEGYYWCALIPGAHAPHRTLTPSRWCRPALAAALAIHLCPRVFRFQGGEERQRLLGLRAGDCLLLLLLAEDPPSAAIRGAPPGAAIAAAAVGPALRAALAQAAKAPLKRLAAGAAEAAAAARRGHIQGFRRGPLGCTLAGRCTGDRKVCGAWKGRSVCSHKACAQPSVHRPASCMTAAGLLRWSACYQITAARGHRRLSALSGTCRACPQAVPEPDQARPRCPRAAGMRTRMRRWARAARRRRARWPRWRASRSASRPPWPLSWTRPLRPPCPPPPLRRRLGRRVLARLTCCGALPKYI